MNAADIIRAADANLTHEGDVEYGLSLEDAALGLLASLKELGLAGGIKATTIRSIIHRRERNRERRWRAANPDYKPGSLYFGISAKAQELVLDQVFNATPMFGILRGKK